MLNRLDFPTHPQAEAITVDDPGDALFIRLKAFISFIALGVDIQIFL